MSCKTKKAVTADVKQTTKTLSTERTANNVLEKQSLKTKTISATELASGLGLTEDQEDQFLLLLDESNTNLQSIHEEYKDDLIGKKDQLLEIKRYRKEKLEEILTAEQLIKYYKLLRQNQRKNKKK